MNILQKIWEAIFPPKKEKTFNEHNKNHQSCDFRVIKFNEKKRPQGYGKDPGNKHKIDDYNFEIEVEDAPSGGRGRVKPPKQTTTTSTTTTTTSSGTTSTTSTTTQGPSGSAVVILLDFDGATVSNTSWNVSGNIVAAPANMTDAEQQVVVDNSSYDYSAFNALVTRDQAVYNAAPANRRIRCIITETNEWYGNNAGGVAYVGSWNWGNDTPCWVFSKLLGYNTKYIMEAVSHEVGHIFGLRHQAVWDANCNLVASYNQGANGEAPIMGVGYYQPDVHWWIGPTSLGCNSIQDDASILANVIGLKS